MQKHLRKLTEFNTFLTSKRLAPYAERGFNGTVVNWTGTSSSLRSTLE